MFGLRHPFYRSPNGSRKERREFMRSCSCVACVARRKSFRPVFAGLLNPVIFAGDDQGVSRFKIIDISAKDALDALNPVINGIPVQIQRLTGFRYAKRVFA